MKSIASSIFLTWFGGVIIWCALTSGASAQAHSGAPAQAPSGPRGPGIDLKKALDVNELKIQMAETQLGIRSSDKNASDLIASLEEFLNSNCFGDLATSLSYDGPVTDPVCLTRMERLLQLNPDNPTALCLRDGLQASTCAEAYRRQRLVAFTGSNMEDLDPILKVGLSQHDKALLEKIQQDLYPLDAKWGSAQTEAEREAILEAALPSYERMMNTACKIVVLRVLRLKSSTKSEDVEIQDLREKLLKIPTNLRAEYQEKMASDAEEKLAQAARNRDENGIKKYTEMIAVARSPEKLFSPLSAENSERLRFVLPQCFDILKNLTQKLGSYPAPLCHTEGWYSPQCINSIKAYRTKMREKALAKKQKTSEGKPSKGITQF